MGWEQEWGGQPGLTQAIPMPNTTPRASFRTLVRLLDAAPPCSLSLSLSLPYGDVGLERVKDNPSPGTGVGTRLSAVDPASESRSSKSPSSASGSSSSPYSRPSRPVTTVGATGALAEEGTAGLGRGTEDAGPDPDRLGGFGEELIFGKCSVGNPPAATGE